MIKSPQVVPSPAPWRQIYRQLSYTDVSCGEDIKILIMTTTPQLRLVWVGAGEDGKLWFGVQSFISLQISNQVCLKTEDADGKFIIDHNLQFLLKNKLELY